MKKVRILIQCVTWCSMFTILALGASMAGAKDETLVNREQYQRMTKDEKQAYGDKMFLKASVMLPAFFGPCEPCPTDAPPVNIPWSGPFSYDVWLDGTDCFVRICYCTRMTSPGNYDYTITEVQYGQGSECDQSIIEKAFQQLKQDNPMGFPCPPCGGEIVNYWREVRGSCWRFVADNPTQATPAYMLCDMYYWCMTPFRICCDEYGQRQEIQGATVIFGAQEPCVFPCFTVPCP